MGDVKVKGTWRNVDVEKLMTSTITVFGESFDAGEYLTQNRIRHSKNVSHIACDLIKLLHPTIKDVEFELFKRATLLHDVMKYAPGADNTEGLGHGTLACQFIKSIFHEEDFIGYDYELIMDAVSMHSDKQKCVEIAKVNPYATSLAFADMIDHTTPEYGVVMKQLMSEVEESSYDAYMTKKMGKVIDHLNMLPNDDVFDIIFDYWEHLPKAEYEEVF